MKKTFYLSAFLMLILSVITFSSYAQASDIKIKLNGKEINMAEKPFIENGRTLVPIRFIAENLGAKVDWNEELKQVTITNSSMIIKLTINENKAYVNEKEITLDTKAIIKNSRTYVPLRFISENMGLKVEWNEAKRTIELKTSDYKEQNLGYKNAEDFGSRKITDFISEGIPKVNSEVDTISVDKIYISSYSDLPLKVGNVIVYKIQKFKGDQEYLKITTNSKSGSSIDVTYIKAYSKKGVIVTSVNYKDENKDGTYNHYYECIDFFHKNKTDANAYNSDYIVLSNFSSGVAVLIDNPFKK